MQTEQQMTIKVKHINVNGAFFEASTPSVMHNNRAFCYGDALFETMHAYQDEVHFFAHHYKRLSESMQKLGMCMPTMMSQEFLHNQIISLLKKNRIYKGSRIRLSIYRNSGGYYTPYTNNISFLIETQELENIQYGFQEKGLQLGIFKDIYKPINKLSSLKTANSMLFVMAGLFKKAQHLDDCIILNEQEIIVETISSNIFLVRGSHISTPPIADGCINGVMRNNIIEIAKSMNYYVTDNVSISLDYIQNVDEIFLTNAVKGIQWVLGFGNKRFFHDASASILLKLNEKIFNLK